MKVSEGGLLLERLAVEEQGAPSAVPKPLRLSTSGPGGSDVDDGRGAGTGSSSSAL